MRYFDGRSPCAPPLCRYRSRSRCEHWRSQWHASSRAQKARPAAARFPFGRDEASLGAGPREWTGGLVAVRRFDGRGFCGRTWVRRPKGESLNPDYCIHKSAHPVKVNVWACFCASGVGYCHIFNDNLDGELLRDILKDNVIPSAKLHFSFDPPEQWFLLHDNDKKFTSGVVKAQLHATGVTTIDFSPYSPDLNPMENLWHMVQQEVDKHSCETMEELQDVVAQEWEKFNNNKEYMKKLVHSMPKRCADVILAQGWHTKY